MDSKPRVAVIMAEKKPPKVEPATGEKEIVAALLDFLHADEPIFIAHSRAAEMSGLHPTTPDGEVGFLWVEFNLSDLRKKLGYNESQDGEILSALDFLCAARWVKIFFMGITRAIAITDIFFRVEIGCAVKEFCRPYTFPTITERVFYSNRPLSDQHYLWGGETIEKPSEKVREIRAERDRQLMARFAGLPPDLGLESKLHREEVQEDARLREAILKIAENLDSKGKKL